LATRNRFLVWDRDQQGGPPPAVVPRLPVRQRAAALAPKLEMLGDYTNGENAKLTAGLGDMGADPVPVVRAAHAGSKEHHGAPVK